VTLKKCFYIKFALKKIHFIVFCLRTNVFFITRLSIQVVTSSRSYLTSKHKQANLFLTMKQEKNACTDNLVGYDRQVHEVMLIGHNMHAYQ